MTFSEHRRETPAPGGIVPGGGELLPGWKGVAPGGMVPGGGELLPDRDPDRCCGKTIIANVIRQWPQILQALWAFMRSLLLTLM